MNQPQSPQDRIMGKVATFTGDSMSAQRIIDFLQEQVDGGKVTGIIAAVHTGPEMDGDVISAWSTCKSGELAHMVLCIEHDIRKMIVS